MRISDWSSDVCSSDLELPDPAPPPDLAIQQAQQQAWLRQAMLSLPPRCRQVFVLVRIDGLSQGEVARRCGIYVKTVAKHLDVAFTALCDKAGISDADDIGSASRRARRVSAS